MTTLSARDLMAAEVATSPPETPVMASGGIQPKAGREAGRGSNAPSGAIPALHLPQPVVFPD